MAASSPPPLPSLVELDLQAILPSVALSRHTPADLSDLLNQAAADPDPANMYMRLFLIFQTLGQDELALAMQARALEQRTLFRLACAGPPSLRLLAVHSHGDMRSNTPLDYLLEADSIRLDLLYMTAEGALPEVLPDHDVLIVAAGESAQNRPLLERLDKLLARWPRPVLNLPRAILGCARDRLGARLAGIPGLLVPHTRRQPRAALAAWGFPLIIRPVDSHAGHGLARLDGAQAIAPYLAAHPAEEYFLADYIDCRDDDGLFRKYRIALIDGRPYLCHLAISAHWIVHYQSAAMADSAAKRQEEAAAMADFAAGFAQTHGTALAAVGERLGLDYAVLDCGVSRDGRLILFEADNVGWIHATDPAALFPYKAPVMAQAFAAFHRLVAERSAVHHAPY